MLNRELAKKYQVSPSTQRMSNKTRCDYGRI